MQISFEAALAAAEKHYNRWEQFVTHAWDHPDYWLFCGGTSDGKATTYKDTNANLITAEGCKFVAKNSGILFV